MKRHFDQEKQLESKRLKNEMLKEYKRTLKRDICHFEVILAAVALVYRQYNFFTS